MAVLIGGGTGFIGSNLSRYLVSKGYTVTLISRTEGPGRITWKDVETKGIPDVDVIVQLPGANILHSTWTADRKKELLDSRVATTSSLVQAITRSKSPPKVFISGSAVGVYPTSQNEEFDESSTRVANNFAGELVHAWEKASELPLNLQATTRRVVMRTGVVLGKNGGMMQKMLLPFRLCLGGRLGSGKQYMPWIHIGDLVALQEHFIKNTEMAGIFNAVAPQIITNKDFTEALAKALNRPAILPMPEFAINYMFGECAFLVLEGQKVKPTRVLASGFEYKYPTIDKALQEISS